jgi:hypothetical protein
MKWPFVSAARHADVQALLEIHRLENYTLRDALREANAEVRRLRQACLSGSHP